MSKVTSKLQVTVPKAIAERYRIRPGDEVLWVASGDSVRLVAAKAALPPRTTEARLRLFDQATKRQRERQGEASVKELAQTRGWTRDELYGRGRGRAD
jgi:AbrB family looped-hinge helix DNA binding protein